jgi:hypothetical protein
VDLAGGSPSEVSHTQQGRGGAWTADGRIVIGGSNAGLSLVPDSGGTALELLPLEPGDAGLRWPQMLPGGRILYFASRSDAGTSGVYLSSLSNPGVRMRLLESDAAAVYARDADRDYLLWLRGDTLVAQELDLEAPRLVGQARVVAESVAWSALSGGTTVTASSTGTLLFNPSPNAIGRLTWIDRSGRPIDVLGAPDEYTVFRLAADGSRVVAARDQAGGSSLWMFDVERGTADPLTSGRGVATYPVWFPDRPTVLFAGGNPRNLTGGMPTAASDA